MIRSFGNKDTERLWNRERVASVDPRIHQVALRKLRQVGSALTLDDLRIPPGNRLEALKGDRKGLKGDRKGLKGDRKGQHSIRINDQWRICFVWKDGDAEDVEVVDYH